MSTRHLAVPDLEEAAAFFTWHLQFRVAAEAPERGQRVLEGGTARFVLSVGNDPHAADQPVLLQADLVDLARAYRSLRNVGASLREVPVEGGVGFVTVAPGGHRIVVMAETKAVTDIATLIN